jgi:hypothetical protein
LAKRCNDVEADGPAVLADARRSYRKLKRILRERSLRDAGYLGVPIGSASGNLRCGKRAPNENSQYS